MGKNKATKVRLDAKHYKKTYDIAHYSYNIRNFRYTIRQHTKKYNTDTCKNIFAHLTSP